MHIAIDVAQTCPERAGCGWYADGLVRALIRRAGPAHRFSLYHHFGAFVNTATQNGTHIPGADHPLEALSQAAAAQFWREVENGSRILAGSPDIVQANSFHAPRVPGTRLVFTVHDVSFWTRPQFTTEANRVLCQRETLAALRHASAFIFVSEFSRSEFERILPGWMAENHIPARVIWPGSRFPLAQPRNSPEDHAPWLFVGTLEPRKNVPTLLDAYDIYLQRSRCCRPLLLAGGNGWQSEQVRARLTSTSANVRWLGYVPDSELSELYHTSFALVCPSWYEGFGLPLAEAMTHGLPVLCSDCSSLREIGGDAAGYFDPSRPDTIADQMLRLESGDWKLRSTQSTSHARHFLWDRAADETLAFYEEVLRSAPLRP